MLKERIEQRLKDLGINQFEAAKRAGKNTNFIYDFLVGRKDSFKGEGPKLVAKALECSVEYLNGEHDEPNKQQVFSGEGHQVSSGLPLVGAVETGTWRRVASLKSDPEWLPVAASTQFPAADQVAYAVRGESLAALGIREGAVLTCLLTSSEHSVLRSGSVVIVESYRMDGEEIELSARELQYYPDRTELLPLTNIKTDTKIILKNNKNSNEEQNIKIVAEAISANILF